MLSANPDFGILLSYLEGNKLISSTRSVTLLEGSLPESPMCGTQQNSTAQCIVQYGLAR